MKLLKLTGCALVLLIVPAAGVKAQCRIGSGPDHGDGVPWCSQLPAPVKAPRGPQWAVQWGAIAYGNGGFGAAKNMFSLNKAKKAALRACVESGGGTYCKVHIFYHDQCVAYAVGDQYINAYARSQMPEEAYDMAIKECSNSTANCKVTYAACSLPVRIR